ncbi:MAG: anti-anti-sigma factor [Pseudonocardiales bacterium]|jgi:anti-sigma B factor antagonist|nr:anti-anti-sigma factor [Pseudonocardiales bacterium]
MTQVELSVSQQSVGEYPVLEVRGEVDVYSAPALADGLNTLIDSGTKAVIVDLTEVGFLDSTGLGVLVAARSAAADAGRALPIACAHERILKLFKITGLDAVFEIHPSVDAAVHSLGHQNSSG